MTVSLLWIPTTIAAAFLQNLRSALQKQMTEEIGVSGVTFARFAYGFPFALVYLLILVLAFDLPVPRPNAASLIYAAVGGLSQIFGTLTLVTAFSLSGFAVGTAYSKTETLQTALFGLIILADPLSLGGFLGILVSLAGVLLLSIARTQVSPRNLLLSWTERPALIGIGSGACFALSAVCYRAASLSLGGEGFLVQAAFTLACVTVFQTLAMTAWFTWRQPETLRQVTKAWRQAAWIGVVGVAASACWFTAMTIQNAAYVRALGQIELVFTFIVSAFVFRERTNRKEFAGVAFIVGGILLLLLVG